MAKTGNHQMIKKFVQSPVKRVAIMKGLISIKIKTFDKRIIP